MIRLVDIPEDIYATIEDDQMLSREQLSILQIHILESEPYEHGQDNNILNVPMSEIIDKVADNMLAKLKQEPNSAK